MKTTATLLAAIVTLAAGAALAQDPAPPGQPPAPDKPVLLPEAEPVPPAGQAQPAEPAAKPAEGGKPESAVDELRRVTPGFLSPAEKKNPSVWERWNKFIWDEIERIDRAFPRGRLVMSGYWKRGETDFRDSEGDQ